MSDQNVKYHQNVLSGFDNGCLLDLRVRFAIDFLKARLSGGKIDSSAQDAVAYALELAETLMNQSEAAGLIESLPEDGGINAALRLQAKRIGTFQVLQQLGSQKAQQEESDRVARPTISMVPSKDH